MPRQLAQQHMTLSDLESPFPHRALSLRYVNFSLLLLVKLQ